MSSAKKSNRNLKGGDVDLDVDTDQDHSPSARRNAKSAADENLGQIEYLLFQSTQGIHFMFENEEIAKVLGTATEHVDFFTHQNMEKVQGLLSSLLDRPSMNEKRSYLDHLAREDYELLLRAYFQLVDNTILAHSTIRH